MSFATFVDRLARAQVSRAAIFILTSAIAFWVSVPEVMKLRLNSDFIALLPTYKPSVQDFDRIGRRVGGLQSLTVALDSHDLPAMQRFARDLVARLDHIGPPAVRSVDWNVHEFGDFARDHKHLYASVAELEEVRDALNDRLVYERGRANPFFVQLDDEIPADPAEVARRIEDRANASTGDDRAGGFYVHPDGRTLFLFVKSSVGGGSTELRGLLATVRHEIDAMHPTRYAADMEVSYAGGVVSALREHDAIEGELKLATSLSVVLVLGVILLFFRKFQAIMVIGPGLAVPVVMTFAIAHLIVGELNTSTAFLGSIVVGNGVNPFIVWLARYYEERRRGSALEEAIAITHRGVGGATLAASLASAVAYGSLIVTDFRGFHDFGIIGVVGMVLSWFGAMLFLPPFIVAVERFLPLRFAADAATENPFGAPIARLVVRAPKLVLAVSSLLALAAFVAVGLAIRTNPIEYDFRNLRSERPPAPVDVRFEGMSDEVKLSRRQADGIAIVLDHLEQVAPLAAELNRLRDEEHAPWGRIRMLQDLLPSDQPEKIEIVEEIRRLLGQLREHASDETRRSIDEHMPPADLHPLTLADLPEAVARPYSESDGTRGTLLLVEQMDRQSVWDGTYMMRWAGALRRVRLSDGTRPPLAGRAPLFADMIESVRVDGPRALAASFGATIVIVIFAFRRWRQRLVTLGSLLIGVVWMTGIMAAMGMKLNFLNFVAFPITFGIGVEYAVNVMRRYVTEQEAGAANPTQAAIAETGGAVLLCSATTVIGYATLLISSNLALRSFGSAMAISEVTCIFAAVVSMPAVLILLERRGGGR